MAQVVLKPNKPVEIVTLSEIAELMNPGEVVSRVRAPASVQLDANGNGKTPVYEVPASMKFELRRSFFSFSGNVPSDAVTGAVALNVAGKWIAWLRSDTLLEYAAPVYGPAVQVPGSQTWGSEQGPELRNKEVLSVQFSGLTPNAVISIYCEGLLSGPRTS